MKSLKLAGLCLASMLVMGMALAGNAAAAPLWLVCLEGSGLTKYESNQCTKASGTGKWQSQGLPKGVRDTVRVQVFSLRLTDKGATGGASAIECNSSSADEGEGYIEGPNKGQITSAKITAPNTRCKRLEGGCKAGEIEEVKGANLPWNTEIIEEAGETRTKIESSGVGEPGWTVRCKTLLGSVTDECTSTSKEYEVVALDSIVSSGVLLARGKFLKAHLAKCSQTGKREGEVIGLTAILLKSGNGLSVNKI